MEKITDIQEKAGIKTFYLILLGALTGGIFYIIWLMERFQVFNEMAGKELLMTKKTITIVAVLMGLSTTCTYYETPFALILCGILEIAWGVMFIIYSFQVAEVLRNYYSENFKIDLKINKILLFFFTIFYLNYKINSLEEIQKTNLAGNVA